MSSPTKHEMSMGIMTLLGSDGDISQYAIDNFTNHDGSADGAYFYASEDYARLGELDYPFVHGFCYSKNETDSAFVYSLVAEVSVLREPVDSSNRFVHDQVGSVVTEGIHGKIDTWVEMIKAQVREDLAVVGIQGTKGFEVLRISDDTLPPQGQDDIRCFLNFDIQLDKCI